MGIKFMEEMTKEIHSTSQTIRATINDMKTPKSQELLSRSEPTDGKRVEADESSGTQV